MENLKNVGVGFVVVALIALAALFLSNYAAALMIGAFVVLVAFLLVILMWAIGATIRE